MGRKIHSECKFFTMSDSFRNPFPASDPDRHAIWEMLVSRDIEAFVNADWSLVQDDFVPETFLGINGNGTDNPDHWSPLFADLETYRDEWLRQAEESAKTEYAEDRQAAIHRNTVLRDIDIVGEVALVHKKFEGTIARADGGKDVMNWQTLYYCRKVDGHWKITGFTGYLPNPMGSRKG